MFQCYIISLRSQDDSCEFEADSIDDALKKARRIADDWELRYDRDTTPENDRGIDGLVRTYKAGVLTLYIHESP